ncbi:hypothetical protein bcgnr5372_64880 [Bacillus luti]|nr:hypothetical protein [Bacillus cereus]HDR8331298.1 hypothetical protein [Bacillus cereus]HDR8335830.1 hypothetical protein [Bacillus cereus]
MNNLKKMTNEELMNEYDWMINRLNTYNTIEQYEYKEELRVEILSRLNQEAK